VSWQVRLSYNIDSGQGMYKGLLLKLKVCKEDGYMKDTLNASFLPGPASLLRTSTGLYCHIRPLCA